MSINSIFNSESRKRVCAFLNFEALCKAKQVSKNFYAMVNADPEYLLEKTLKIYNPYNLSKQSLDRIKKTLKQLSFSEIKQIHDYFYSPHAVQFMQETQEAYRQFRASLFEGIECPKPLQQNQTFPDFFSLVGVIQHIYIKAVEGEEEEMPAFLRNQLLNLSGDEKTQQATQAYLSHPDTLSFTATELYERFTLAVSVEAVAALWAARSEKLNSAVL